MTTMVEFLTSEVGKSKNNEWAIKNLLITNVVKPSITSLAISIYV